MAYTVQRIPNEPIIVLKVMNPFNPAKEVPEQNAEIAKLSQGVTPPVYLISDLSELKISFSDLVVSLAEVKRDEESAFNNKNLVTLTVGSNEMVRLSVEAAKQKQYGGVNIQIFGSVDEAIAHARSLAKK
jgi:hypothetical protein